MRPAGVMMIPVGQRKKELADIVTAEMFRLIRLYRWAPLIRNLWSRPTLSTPDKPDEGIFRRGDIELPAADGKPRRSAQRYAFHYLESTRGFLSHRAFPTFLFKEMFDALDELRRMIYREVISKLGEALDQIYPNGEYRKRFRSEEAINAYNVTRVVAYEEGFADPHFDRSFGTVHVKSNYAGFRGLNPATKRLEPVDIPETSFGLFLSKRLSQDTKARGYRAFPAYWHDVEYVPGVQEAVGMRITIAHFFYAFPYDNVPVRTRT